MYICYTVLNMLWKKIHGSLSWLKHNVSCYIEFIIFVSVRKNIIMKIIFCIYIVLNAHFIKFVFCL